MLSGSNAGLVDDGRKDAMNTMNYLFAAYTAIWIILAIYLYSIHARETKLRADVQRLKQLVEKSQGSAK